MAVSNMQLGLLLVQEEKFVNPLHFLSTRRGTNCGFTNVWHGESRHTVTRNNRLPVHQ